MSEEILKKHIKSRELAKLYLLYGEEDYLKDFYCRSLCRAAVAKGMESFNLHRFDADTFELPHYIAALENMPLMSEYKCVVLRDVDYDAMKLAEWKEFLGTLSDIPPQTVLILWYDTLRPGKKSSRFQALKTAAQKVGLGAEIQKPSRRELEKWIRRLVTAEKCTIAEEAVARLLEYGDGDMNLLRGEIEKLCAFADGGEIADGDVEQLTVKPLSASVYELSRAILAGKPKEGLALLDEYFYRREEPVVILAALSGAFCDLLRAKTAQDSGAGQPELLRDFNYRGREFRVRGAFYDCRGASAGSLSRCMELLMQADRKLKSARADKRLILEQLVVELCGERGRGGD